MINLSGVFPPIPTSFDGSGELDLNSLQKNLQHLSSFALAGFLVLGSNGETVMMSDHEKACVFEAARKAIPGNMLMLAGTGGQSTRETIEVTKVAAMAGADAAVVLNPYYYKGLMTKDALVGHYRKVADQSAIPLVIYNMPANTGLDLTAETILAIAEHPNVIGLKDSGGNLAKMGEIILKARPGFQVLAGSAGFLLPALSIGAVGGIMALANIVPKQCLDIFHLFLSGQIAEARYLHNSLISLNNLVTRDQGVPALKAAMDHIGLNGGPCREPILPLSPSLKEMVLSHLNNLSQ